jgi:amino acid transporter
MADKTQYKRTLGLIELVSLGVGGTIGSGIFVVPGVAARLSGAASLYVWLIVAISASCVLVSLAAVSTQFTGSGSFYSLFESVFGRNVAVTLILLYLVSSIFGVSTIAAGIGQYITWLGITHALIIEVGILAAFCCINIVGISLSGKTENILTALKIIPLILISVLLIPCYGYRTIHGFLWHTRHEHFIRPENLGTSAPVSTAGRSQRSSSCTDHSRDLRSVPFLSKRPKTPV